ncbi:MAG: extracellular solute-binding protein [Chloroflexi bacterium]|nr:extracellular solute-binding protein [Chloroflexota bacterium]
MSRLLILLSVALLAFLAGCASAGVPPAGPGDAAGQAAAPQPQKAAWEVEWDNTVRAGRAEGKVVVYGDLSAEEKDAVAKGLAARYGITLELLSGKAAEIAQKTLSERNAGLYIPDVNMSGVVGSIVLLKPRGVTQGLDSALILPEVKEPNVWLEGRMPWVDNDHTQIQFVAEVFPGVTINTEMPGTKDIRVYRDLLDPKWKGKMVLADPTNPSSGSQWFAKMTGPLGEDYMRAFARQEPVISRNDRLMVEWIARGRYPIGVAMQASQVWKFMREGAPITVVDTEVHALSPQHGCISLMKDAPHPNAAKVFLNWLLSKEGQTAFAQGSGSPSRRMDVPTADVVPVAIPKAGKKYIEDNDETLGQRTRMAELAGEIFRPLLAK